MTAENIVHVDSSNWQSEVLQSSIPVLVDFWAEWCGPCQMMGRVLEEVAPQLAGKVKIAKVNVDEEQKLAAQFHIRSIPTLLIFKDGKVEEQMVGAMNKSTLLAKLSQYISP